MAQTVERVLGKDEVTGSNPVSSSTLKPLKDLDFAWLSAVFLYILQSAFFIQKQSKIPSNTFGCKQFVKKYQISR